MGATKRVASLLLSAVVFSLKPVEVQSLSVSPVDQLSSWHPADQVPCAMHLHTTTGCKCVTVFEEIHISEPTIN